MSDRPRIPAEPYVAPADLLAGRIVLVTGAAEGIGRAAALCFARHGASVVLADRSVPALEAVYDRIEAEGGAQPALLPLDAAAAGPLQYQEAATRVAQAFGRLDGLLHAALELGAFSPVEHSDPGLWARVLAVNLHAPYLLTRALIGLLKRSPQAAVLFSGGVVERPSGAYCGAYGVSAYGRYALTRILAEELEGRVRVNSIDPGAVRTAMRSRAYPGEDPQAAAAPEAVMPAYLYLIGPQSKAFSGCLFKVDRDGRITPLSL